MPLCEEEEEECEEEEALCEEEEECEEEEKKRNCWVREERESSGRERAIRFF